MDSCAPVCSVCGSKDVIVRTEDTADHDLGLPGVVLRNVKVISCPDCEMEFTELPAVGLLVDRVRREICWLGRVLTPSEFGFLRQTMGLTGQQFSEAIGVTNVSVSRWENGRQRIPATTDLLLRVMTLSSLGGIPLDIPGLLLEIRASDQQQVVVDVRLIEETSKQVHTFTLPSARNIEAPVEPRSTDGASIQEGTLSELSHG